MEDYQLTVPDHMINSLAEWQKMIDPILQAFRQLVIVKSQLTTCVSDYHTSIP